MPFWSLEGDTKKGAEGVFLQISSKDLKIVRFRLFI